jgi:hypothetical protein
VLSFHRAGLLTDDVGTRLYKFRNVKTLTLSGCASLTDLSFSDLESTENLEHLNLGSTGISERCALHLLPKLKKLERLNLVLCRELGPAVLSALPCTLSHLDFSLTRTIDGSVLSSDFEYLPELVSIRSIGLDSRHTSFSDLAVLANLV